MAFEGGRDWTETQRGIADWVVACTGLPADSVLWGRQESAPRPGMPGITMWVVEHDPVNTAWTDVEDNYLEFSPKTVTSVSIVNNALAIPAHELENGDGPVTVASTGTLPAGLEADTPYWVIVLDDGSISLAATFAESGGAAGSGNPSTAIDLSSAGTGTITVRAAATTRRVGEELLEYARVNHRLVLRLECHARDGVGIDMATAILARVSHRSARHSNYLILEAINVGLVSIDRVRALGGRLDTALFEPRAQVDVVLTAPSEETLALAAIETVIIENEELDQVLQVDLSED